MRQMPSEPNFRSRVRACTATCAGFAGVIVDVQPEKGRAADGLIGRGADMERVAAVRRQISVSRQRSIAEWRLIGMTEQAIPATPGVFTRASSGLVRSISTTDALYYGLNAITIAYVTFTMFFWAKYPGASYEWSTAL